VLLSVSSGELALSKFNLHLADHLVQVVKVDDHILQITGEARLESQNLDGASLCQSLLEYLLYLSRCLAVDLEAKDVGHFEPSFTSGQVFFHLDVIDLLGYSEDSVLAPNFSIRAEEHLHVVCESCDSLLSQLGNKSGQVVS